MSGKVYKLDTQNTSLVFLQDGQSVFYLYYGKKISEISPETTFLKEDNIGTDLRNKLFSCFGDDDHRDKSILLFNPDNTFTNEFVFKSATVSKGKKAIPCLPSSFGAEKTLSFDISCAMIFNSFNKPEFFLNTLYTPCENLINALKIRSILNFDSMMEKGLLQAKANESKPAKEVFANLRKRI